LFPSLARLTVEIDEKGVHVFPHNIAAFAMNLRAVASLKTLELIINGKVVNLARDQHEQIISQDNREDWKVSIVNQCIAGGYLKILYDR
jgi:hypothetical protein